MNHTCIVLVHHDDEKGSRTKKTTNQLHGTNWDVFYHGMHLVHPHLILCNNHVDAYCQALTYSISKQIQCT